MFNAVQFFKKYIMIYFFCKLSIKCIDAMKYQFDNYKSFKQFSAKRIQQFQVHWSKRWLIGYTLLAYMLKDWFLIERILIYLYWFEKKTSTRLVGILLIVYFFFKKKILLKFFQAFFFIILNSIEWFRLSLQFTMFIEKWLMMTIGHCNC